MARTWSATQTKTLLTTQLTRSSVTPTQTEAMCSISNQTTKVLRGKLRSVRAFSKTIHWLRKLLVLHTKILISLARSQQMLEPFKLRNANHKVRQRQGIRTPTRALFSTHQVPHNPRRELKILSTVMYLAMQSLKTRAGNVSVDGTLALSTSSETRTKNSSRALKTKLWRLPRKTSEGKSKRILMPMISKREKSTENRLWSTVQLIRREMAVSCVLAVIGKTPKCSQLTHHRHRRVWIPILA